MHSPFIYFRPVCPRTSSVERYIPEENVWETVQSIPFIPTCAFAFALEGHLVVIATDSSAESQKEVLIYDLDVVCGGWSSMVSSFPPMTFSILCTIFPSASLCGLSQFPEGGLPEIAGHP